MTTWPPRSTSIFRSWLPSRNIAHERGATRTVGLDMSRLIVRVAPASRPERRRSAHRRSPGRLRPRYPHGSPISATVPGGKVQEAAVPGVQHGLDAFGCFPPVPAGRSGNRRLHGRRSARRGSPGGPQRAGCKLRNARYPTRSIKMLTAARAHRASDDPVLQSLVRRGPNSRCQRRWRHTRRSVRLRPGAGCPAGISQLPRWTAYLARNVLAAWCPCFRRFAPQIGPSILLQVILYCFEAVTGNLDDPGAPGSPRGRKKATLRQGDRARLADKGVVRYLVPMSRRQQDSGKTSAGDTAAIAQWYLP